MRPVSNKQSGMVSILTVLFFMIFISIIVVGFIKIMSDEQRQSTDNDLSASALAAAQSGVEDGKRIIQHCLDKSANGSNANGLGSADAPGSKCNKMLTSSSAGAPCDVFTKPAGGMNALRNQLGIFLSSNNDVIVSTSGSDESYQQYYTCLTINQNTSDVKYYINEGRSIIVPLRTLAAPDNVDIAWKSSDGSYDVPASSSSLQPDVSWTSAGKRKPPVLRVQFIGYNPGGFDINAVESASHAMFLVPSNDNTLGQADVSTAENRGATGQLRTSAGYPMNWAYCTAVTGYSCTKNIKVSTSLQYYVRLTLLYGNGKPAEVSVTPRTGAGATVLFDKVQYEIDVTGRTNDVFRRVQARVAFGAPDFIMPEYALESASTVCKDITVADATWSHYNCP